MKSKKTKKSTGSGKRAMILGMAISVFGCLVFGMLSHYFHMHWAMGLMVTFGTFAYHLVIRFLVPPILAIFTHKKYNEKNWWFQSRA